MNSTRAGCPGTRIGAGFAGFLAQSKAAFNARCRAGSAKKPFAATGMAPTFIDVRPQMKASVQATRFLLPGATLSTTLKSMLVADVSYIYRLLERKSAVTTWLQNGIFGFPFDLKSQSWMTLFARVAPDETVFRTALERFFDALPDQNALKLLKAKN